jgi:hypothetical protein
MPRKKLTFTPGINTQATQTLNANGFSSSNLIRWLNGGFLQKYGGWKKLFSASTSGLVRSMHAYEDLSGANNLLIGTDAGPEIYVGGTLYQFDLVRKTSQTVGNATLSSVSGSNVITVSDIAHSAVVGSQAYLGIPTSVGGSVIWSQIVTVTTVPTANSWTFTASFVASTTGFGDTPSFQPTIGSSSVQVSLNNHGLIVGSNFQINYPVYWSGGCGPSLPAGNYSVTNVPNSFQFFITGGSIATSNANGRESYDGNIGDQMVLQYIQVASFPANSNWYTDNFGNNGIFSYTNGPIYQYSPPISTNLSVGLLTIIANAPQVNTGVLVAMPQAQIIAFGSETIIGSSVQDPLLLRWCSVGDTSIWLANSTNQAGSYRLSRGSRIIGGLQSPQTTMIWTDVDLWSMKYQGGQFVYSFNVLGSGCGLIAPKAAAVIGGTTFWMGSKSFWIYGGNGVQPLDCSVYDVVFGDLDPANQSKCFAAANSSFNEISFYFPSLSGGTGEIDSYVKYNALNQAWDSGKLGRTAWIDTSIFGAPLGSDLGLHVQQHDTGFDADTSAMVGAFAETGYAVIEDGNNMMFVDQVIPDFKWRGANGFVNMTIFGANFPGSAPVMYGPFTITPTTSQVAVRLRHRLIAFRWEWGNSKGFDARIGAPMVRFAPAGRQ